MDFGALPPEVNSAFMYSGPGAGPMTAAATAWSRLATELYSTSAQYRSVIADLTGEQWRGAASESMAAAVLPYVDWMELTASQLQHAAQQAGASAAAFEAAFGMTVPPPVIAANRAQFTALVATNFLGLNTAAIMGTEALYADMWAQDAAAMYGYAAASASAAELSPPTAPAAIATPTGLGAQAAAVAQASGSTHAGLAQAVSALPGVVAELASPMASVSTSDIISSVDGLLGTPFVSIAVNGFVSAAGWWSMNTIPNAVLAGHTLGVGAAPAVAASATVDSVAAPAAIMAGAAAPGGATRPPLSVGLGVGTSVGGLSVPPGWASSTQLAQSISPAPTSGWVADAEAGTSALPAGIPAAASASKGGHGGPRYGIKPTVMPRTGLS